MVAVHFPSGLVKQSQKLQNKVDVANDVSFIVLSFKINFFLLVIIRFPARFDFDSVATFTESVTLLI